MELGTTIIGLAAIALISLPFVLMSRSKKKKEKQLFNSLQSVANKYDCSISEFDLGSDFGIGMTTNNERIIFYKNKNGIEVEKSILLENIQKCKVNSIKNSSKSNGNGEAFVERLELDFVSKNKKSEELKLEFYNSKDSFHLNGEFQLILKWEEQINTILEKL